MEITLNGQRRDVPDGLTVSRLLGLLELFRRDRQAGLPAKERLSTLEALARGAADPVDGIAAADAGRDDPAGVAAARTIIANETTQGDGPRKPSERHPS